MTDHTFILPYDRASPAHIPRRDLVLSGADSLSLRITVVESDNPNAQALELTGGIGAPALIVSVWRDSPTRRLDYGAPVAPAGDVLWSGQGIISDAAGSFDLLIPAATMASWPLRCGWSAALSFDAATQAETLCEGTLHVRPSYGPTAPATAVPITTDALDPITTD